MIDSPAFFIGKEGGDLISFGSGQPDLPPPEEIYSVLSTFRKFKYGLVQGNEELREAISKFYPHAHANQFVITNGASEALDLIIRYIGEVAKKRKFLIPRPHYYSYPHIVKLAGLEVEYYDLEKGKIDLDDFRKKCEGCAGVLINSPSNPTGMVQEVETLKEIEKLTKDMFVVSDEVYKDIMYTRENYLIQGPKVITVNSFSKTYAMCGDRIGYFYSTNPELVHHVIDHKNYTSMNTNLLAQEMALEATKVHDSYAKEHLKIWEERRDLIYNGMKELGLDLWKPEGAFYVFVKFPSKYGTANEIMHKLYKDYKLIAYDGAWFGDPERVRFSYALDKEKIEEGLKRLKKFLEESI